jgi:sugar lactone lactonase YvrE
MSTAVTRFRAAAALGASSLLAVACSRSGGPDEVATAAGAVATPPLTEISIPGSRIFPESITSASDGTLYIGSVGQAQIYRAAPGAATAEVFIPPGTGGMKQIFGVLADEASGTLWACSNQLADGPPGAAPPGPSSLHSFELATGAPKASHALPAGAMCNDIAVGTNGDTYATDTSGMRVMRLPLGADALEAWSPAGAFGEPGAVLDGIAMVGGRVIVNTLRTNKLFAVEVGADGKAGAVQELTLSAPLGGPDGMRTYGGNGVLVTYSADGIGKIQHVTISGDSATVIDVKDELEGPVSVTAVGNTGYALEGQLALMFAPPGGTAPAEKPYRAVVFQLP